MTVIIFTTLLVSRRIILDGHNYDRQDEMSFAIDYER